MQGIKCSLNKNYKEALKQADKHIKEVITTRVTQVRHWRMDEMIEREERIVTWKYKNRKINKKASRLIFAFSILSCCGISEAIWTYLHAEKHLVRWSQEDFNILVAWYIKKCRFQKDKRVLITGLPMQVRETSSYNTEFYKKIKTALLHFGFVEVTKAPYLNQNSSNKISVLIGRYS